MNKIEPTFTDDFGDIRKLTAKAWEEQIASEKKEPIFSSDDLEVSSINPNHYRSHPSGVECITVTEHMGFNLGNAVKYIWRAELKNNDGGLEDLRKSLWYIKRELNRRATK